MKQKKPLRHLSNFLKLFMIGSLVASRSATGAATPEETLEHELAWIAARDGLIDATPGIQLPVDIRRLVDQGFDGNFDLRVRTSYRGISPDEIADLDALWMASFSENGVDADVVDRFIVARAATLPEMMQENAAEIDSSDKWRTFIREFKRAPYSGG